MAFILDMISGWIRRAADLIADLLRLKLATLYVQLVERVRRFFTSALAALAGTVLAVAGFLIVHVGLFLLLPWSSQTKGLVLLILGLVYIIVPLIFVLWFCSHRTWMKLSRADELVDRLTAANKK